MELKFEEKLNKSLINIFYLEQHDEIMLLISCLYPKNVHWAPISKKSKNISESEKPGGGLVTLVKTEPVDTEDRLQSPVNIKVEIEET